MSRIYEALEFAGVAPIEAAWASIAITFAVRLAAITFNWKTRAARPLLGDQPRD